MDPKNQEVFVKVLACLAWADGFASADEKSKLAELVASTGTAIDRGVVMSLIETNRELSPGLLEEVKLMPIEIFVSLLVFSLEIVGVDNVITVDERAAIHKLGGVFLVPEKVEKLFEWFELKKKADLLFDDVFDSVII